MSGRLAGYSPHVAVHRHAVRYDSQGKFAEIVHFGAAQTAGAVLHAETLDGDVVGNEHELFLIHAEAAVNDRPGVQQAAQLGRAADFNRISQKDDRYVLQAIYLFY